MQNDSSLSMPIDWRVKGAPALAEPVALQDVGRQGWELLREDLMLPVAVLRQSALRHNSGWMRRFAEASGVHIAPHGKTTMSPQLFDMQFADGAWGLTAATVGHVRIYRQHGIGRILMANQLVGRQNIAYVAQEMRHDPAFDFYCLVDSVESVALLEGALAQDDPGRPLQVLIELGITGGRAGLRCNEEALHLARRVAASRWLSLRGVEAFEGIVQGAGDAAGPQVQSLLERMTALTLRGIEEGLFAGPVLLTAGGSSFFDAVAATFGRARAGENFEIILRSGCYLVHDSGFYEDLLRRLQARSAIAAELGEGLRPALEVWAYVHSRPEPGRIIISAGKRDLGNDVHEPVPLCWARPGDQAPTVRPLSGEHRIARLDDQHAYADVPASSPLQVGDMVAMGISHPCTTFDKWKAIYLVDDALRVTGAVQTFF